KLIEVVSVNGGHLASNLGFVELTVMLHKCFNCPKDSIVWDVGHQSYVHKMLTGRFDEIDTIRQKDGLAGFPKRSESESDAFNAGHSSTSISAAYGIAKAKQLKGEQSYTVAVIGDGSMTGGLAYEGLNNAGRFKKNFIVILNDNKMSISNNVGAVAKHLSHMRIKPAYIRAKRRTEKILSHIPLLGKLFKKILKRSKSKLKNLIYKNTLFDVLGYTYLGPVDGHDMEELNNALTLAKKINGPVLIHVVTKKGKGYEPAESHPKEFHGIGKFDINTGEPLSSQQGFSSVFASELCSMAEEDKKIVAITAAMTLGTGLSEFSKQFKTRFFDVGIAEEHAITFACGLATKGIIPFFAVYSTFLQRGFDQLIHDAAIQNLHVVLAVDRAGIVGDDGETHQGTFDVSMLNTIPNTTIFSPCYFSELKHSLNAAAYMCKGLVSVRYPRGGELYMPENYTNHSIDFDLYGDENAGISLVTYGRLFSFACKAKEALAEQGININIIKLCRIKPIDPRAVELASMSKRIFFFEESLVAGGIGESFGYELKKTGKTFYYKIHGIKDRFVRHETVLEALNELELDDEGMVKIIKENI
ncbi:MAG: 1-deoxy-D-xylulose-5-phosphate synthase, partial [Ruminococcus sp.]|nr:1-deoxy-D-xylulose-5-phosphate synthase [Ruminococcus sp.]